ncbi:unnamed protein product [Arabis nemorensis]|uniref:Auxin-responsive protein n=1 Tax=Arabis nemorensis TaxID=586526 RepID=A0A565B8L2_9BRAS|nr:unnamed protein product [Arabis nemorensis]
MPPPRPYRVLYRTVPSLCPSESSVNLSLSLTFPSTSPQRETRQDWPPIKSLLRDTLKGRRLLRRGDDTSLCVKVYMEGVAIGRKLDLCAFSGYESLLENLSHMFGTSIIYKDGDWMMLEDIPWEDLQRGTELLMSIATKALKNLENSSGESSQITKVKEMEWKLVMGGRGNRGWGKGGRG